MTNPENGTNLQSRSQGAKRSLVQNAITELRSKIDDAALQPGLKLPPEKVLAVELGVSRTVIREAIASLSADGFLEVRHGVGLFVSAGNDQEKPGCSPLTASLPDILELRQSVEVKAAGLAAARRSWAQEAKIWQMAAGYHRAVAAGQPAERQDWTFHRAIAEATNNAAFLEFFDSMGMTILPFGMTLSATGNGAGAHEPTDEHQRICEAIARQDVRLARLAMEEHLAGAQLRYRRHLTAPGQPPAA